MNWPDHSWKHIIPAFWKLPDGHSSSFPSDHNDQIIALCDHQSDMLPCSFIDVCDHITDNGSAILGSVLSAGVLTPMTESGSIVGMIFICISRYFRS